MSLHPSFPVSVRLAVAGLVAVCLASPAAAQTERMYFPAYENVTNVLVQRINAETQRIDMSAWYLSEGAIVQALLGRHRAGVQIRLIGDRGSIFEIDAHTKNAFYELAAAGVPIRLRYNPTWFPEIAHWKATIFVGQGIVTFGSANYTPFELAPVSSTNYKDETVLFTNDVELVRAFKTKFDRFWNDTTTEPESRIGGPPYFRNWADACSAESACSDYWTRYPNRAPMVIDTRRLEPDYALPSEMVWGQGPSFNNRLVQAINEESTRVDFVIYRLTVDNITQALLSKHQSGVPVRLIIEPNEYLNRKWPEFWLTHANIDKLWAAGVPVKWRTHEGLTHMKMLVTSNVATNASSNLAANWQRDHNYFVPAATKPAVHQAMRDRFQQMWTDTAGFTNFVPQPPDAPGLVSPGNGAGGVATTATLTWNRAAFATSYDVYIGPSSSNMTLAGNVPAQLVQDPPTTYSFQASLQPGTTYFWQVVSRTNATPRNSSLVASSSVRSFTTSGTATQPPPPTSSLPSPWTNQDVGATGATGSASLSGGAFTVRGAGADIWGSADSFHFAHQPLSGDGQIVARVTGLQNTHTYAKAGVMMRAGTTTGAAHVLLSMRPNGSFEFLVRSSAGGSTSSVVPSAGAPSPAWLRLQRSGSTVTGAVSSDGSNWTTLGSTTVGLPSTVNAGLAVTSHVTGVLNTAGFDNVSVTAGGVTPPPPPPPSSLPSPWQGQDVGAVGQPGSASHSNGVFTVNGAGADIWGSADAFHFVYQSLAGDGQIVARVASVQNTNAYAKAGVMLRSGLSAGSSHVILDVRPGGSVEFMQRSASGGSTSYLGGATQAPPAWLRLSRSGTTVTAAVSPNGSSWTTVGTTSVSFGSSVYAGLVVNSHDTTRLNTSTFDNVSVTAGTTTPPPPPPPSAAEIVLYASDVTALNGSWSSAADPTSPNGVKLVTTDAGFAAANQPLSSPADYVDVSFTAEAGVPYRIWLRLKALNNSKYNDAVWVQFSNARVNGSPAYAIGSTSGLLVNLATDGTGSSLSNWGWQNGAYWLSQATAVTFAASGTQTMRIQVREDGVQLDQIVLSPSRFFNAPPGGVSNDATIVSK